jgi:hypothetical protein
MGWICLTQDRNQWQTCDHSNVPGSVEWRGFRKYLWALPHGTLSSLVH